MRVGVLRAHSADKSTLTGNHEMARRDHQGSIDEEKKREDHHDRPKLHSGGDVSFIDAMFSFQRKTGVVPAHQVVRQNSRPSASWILWDIT